jgi:hypothetical protein
MWVQAFDIAQGTEEDVRTAINVFKEVGIKNIAAWGYRGCKDMSYLACDDPDKVWRIVGESYKEFLESK